MVWLRKIILLTLLGRRIIHREYILFMQFETPTVRAYVHKGRALASLKRYQEVISCSCNAIH